MTTSTTAMNASTKAPRITKKTLFADLRVLALDAERDDLVEFIDKEISHLENKASGSSKPTAKQIENGGIKDAIYLFLVSCDTPKTITEIMCECSACADLTNQRVTALVRQLKEDGKVEKTIVKRVSYFSAKA